MDSDCPATDPTPGGDGLDPYPAAFEPETSCDPIAKPGIIAFRRWVLDNWGETAGQPQNIVRSCNPNASSGHEEGRAWDWTWPGAFKGEKAIAKAMLETLLEPDADGRPHALARRAGILYIIFDRRIWSAYPSPKGTRVWRPYSGADPHTTHVHFSLTWAGARGETSLYTGV